MLCFCLIKLPKGYVAAITNSPLHLSPSGGKKGGERKKKPQPKSRFFSRSYGSSSPTSLTYSVLSTRGFSPGRPAAVMSTTTHNVMRIEKIKKKIISRFQHYSSLDFPRNIKSAPRACEPLLPEKRKGYKWLLY
jgi:hypothetical protein